MERERKPIVDCIVPAKGRSVRFPGKNKAEINGKPILGWVIDVARDSGVFRDVYVSTDDREIADITTSYGGIVLNRPPHLAEDNIPVYKVVESWVEDWLYDMLPEYIAIIHPTAWGFLSRDIQIMWGLLQQFSSAQGIMAIVRPFEHPYGAMELIDGRWLKLHNSDGKLKRDQEMPKLYMDAGYCYIYSVVDFLEYGFYPEKLLGYNLPRGRVVDINMPEDLGIAKVLAKEIEKWKS